MPVYNSLIEALDAHAVSDRWVNFIEGKSQEVTLSFAQLRERALRLLGDLQYQGVKPGDYLVLFLRDNQRFVEVFWACMYGGIIPVPIAVGISDEHRWKLFNVYSLLVNAYVYTTTELAGQLTKFADKQDRTSQYQGMQSRMILSQDIGASNRQGEVKSVAPDDTAFIQFSSGSTSDPKGVVLTHRNIVVNVLAKAHAGGYREDEISLSWMPLTHDMGLIGFHLNMIVMGMRHCIMATDLFSRRPLIWLQKVSEKRASVICSPNFGYKHYLKALGDKQPEGIDLSCVRIILNGAEPISTQLCEDFLQRLAPHGLQYTAMLPVYGLAEATLAVAFPKLARDYQAVYVDRHKMRIGDKVTYVQPDHADATSFAVVGYAVPDIEIRIADEQGKALTDETVGCVEINGPTVTQGYFKNPDATKEVLHADGWLNTGDLGFISDGQLVITGRSKEVIFVNGLNYYPHDIEVTLTQGGEFELGKVVACGYQQTKDQSDLILLYVLYRGDLQAFNATAHRASHIVSESMGLTLDHVIPIRQIPKTTSGKILRRKLSLMYGEGEFNCVINELIGVEQLNTRACEVQSATISADSLETKLQAIFYSVAKKDALCEDDNYFDIGLNSLQLAEIHQKIDDQYPKLLDIIDMFEYQTIKQLADFLRGKGCK